MKNGLLRLGLVFLTLTFLPSASAENPSGLPDSLVKNAAKEIFVVLQSLEGIEKGIQTREILPSSLTFDGGSGWELTLYGGGVSARIRILETRRLSITLNKNRLPKFQLALSVDNQMVSIEKIIRENTKIEMSVARDTAETVAKGLFGEHVLENLRMVRGEAASTGNYVGYVFRWKPEEPFLMGCNSITIWIHPKTGSLYSVSRCLIEPPEPPVSAEEARRMASDFLAEKKYPLSIKRVHLHVSYDKSGTAQPAWSVEARGEKRNRFGFYDYLLIEVDATSGAVSLHPAYAGPDEVKDTRDEMPTRIGLSVEEVSALMPVPDKYPDTRQSGRGTIEK